MRRKCLAHDAHQLAVLHRVSSPLRLEYAMHIHVRPASGETASQTDQQKEEDFQLVCPHMDCVPRVHSCHFEMRWLR